MITIRRGRGEQRGNVFDNPQIPLSSDGITYVLGSGMNTEAGVNVSEFNVMRISAMWRCVSLLSGVIAALPIHVNDVNPDGTLTPAAPHPLLEEPYPGMTWYELMELLLVHLLVWGNGYLYKVRNSLGEIVQLLPLMPWNVVVERPKNVNGGLPLPKQYKIINGTGPTIVLDDEDVIHIPGLGYDGLKGLSPVAFFRQGLGLALAAEEFGARLFGSGTLLAGILTTDTKLTQDQADALKQRWRERMTGLARAHEIGVLDLGAKYQSIGIPPEDAQFIQTRQFSVEEVCRWYGVPPHLVSMVDKTTSWGAGIAEQSLGLARYTLTPWTTRIEQRLTTGILRDALTVALSESMTVPRQAIKFDMDMILRGDTAARYAAYSTALSARWLNRNEVRAKEGLAPVDGLDEYDPPPAPPLAPIAPPVVKDPVSAKAD